MSSFAPSPYNDFANEVTILICAVGLATNRGTTQGGRELGRRALARHTRS